MLDFLVDVPISLGSCNSSLQVDHLYMKLPFLRPGDVTGVPHRSESHIDPDEQLLAKKSSPLHIQCRACRSSISSSDTVFKSSILPSDHWGDIMDSMFCHLPEDLPSDSIGASVFASRLTGGTRGKVGIKEMEIVLHKDDLKEGSYEMVKQR